MRSKLADSMGKLTDNIISKAAIKSVFSVFERLIAVKGGAIDYKRDPYYHVMAPLKVQSRLGERVRVNLILPSVHKDHLTGGPATLVNYVKEVDGIFEDCAIRLIPVMVPFPGSADDLPGKIKNYNLGKLLATQEASADVVDHEIIADAAHRNGFLPITKNDVFIASMWPTHYVAKDLQKRQQEHFGYAHKIQYIIQDYESSAIYPWSDLFLYAEQTYTDTSDTIGVVGTRFLHDYLADQGHDYDASYWFEPGQNAVSSKIDRATKKDEIIVIYGRPDTPRNCFSLLMEALLKLTAEHPSIAKRFTFVSVGEKHPNYKLNNGAVLNSLGFMPVDDYRNLLAKAAVGCFVVVSPHTGYICLEMARNGMLSVSNSFRTKEIQQLHPNIRPVEAMDVNGITDKLLTTVQEFWRAPDSAVGIACQIEDERAQKMRDYKEFPFIEDLFSRHYNFSHLA